MGALKDVIRDNQNRNKTEHLRISIQSFHASPASEEGDNSKLLGYYKAEKSFHSFSKCWAQKATRS